MTEVIFSDYQKYIHQSRYARWIEKEKRRETWPETVNRYLNHFCNDERTGKMLDSELRGRLFSAILQMQIMPSMRCMMTAGEALEKDQVAGYNCSYLVFDHPRAFDEMMYVLMCGTGVGYSVERQYINKLPDVAEDFHSTDTVIKVADSKIGWAKAFKELLSLLWTGQIPKWDVSNVRPSGAKLKTFGGRASGPEPLVDLFEFSVSMFRRAAGRKLNSLECHDLACKIADIVVVGGVRRSACISLSNLSDDRMRRAKSGAWWEEHGHRRLANNSACYSEKPDFESFLAEWTSLYESKSGERGIFSRVASIKKAAQNGRRDTNHEFGTNPCSEIILRPYQFCNLSEVVVRADDTIQELKEKVRLATILGTLQSTQTDFRYLRSIWIKNTEEERLLGVSLTGIMDHPLLNEYTNSDELSRYLDELKQVAIATNEEWSNKLGINHSTAITCTKPSGTVSQLVDSASGIHPRFAPYYIRRVRGDVKDPLTMFLKEQNIPWEQDVMNKDNLVFSFPQKSPFGAKCVKDVGALDQLAHWKLVNDAWCEHKPSITIYYKDSEFLELGQHVFNSFDQISGISFLPYSDHKYPQAPYEEITQEQYETLLKEMPKVDWEAFKNYEIEDNVMGTRDLACSAGVCEII